MYVYCVGDGLSAELFGDLCGVGDVPVRLLVMGGLAAVVSEFAGEAVELSAGNVRAHNRVNARVLARSTPLPFRFGTLAGEQRLAEYVAGNESTLLDALKRVRGCVEMGVKVRRDAEKAKVKRQKAQEEDEEGGAERDAAAGVDVRKVSAGVVSGTAAGSGTASEGSGTAFLLAKRREILGDEASRRRAEEVAAWLASRVSDSVRESSLRVGPSESLVVRAAHLVERARLEEYRARVRELTDERADLHFLTSGPWPPYSFSHIERH
ncbi:MAG TPA: GvpL/GvpF family gas vesicle protein [Pyrinomonadaceae bacterium]|nr:GvpL/GvpF family gas vesicle protein [Pyrinomonadaceae bacterium]